MEPERRPEGPDEEPPHYLVQRVREALAHDGRVNELELQVKVQGRRVFLGGVVPTQERHDAVEQVVRDLVPDCEVMNETTIGTYGEPTEAENLS